ncbi:MAG TPA: twin-arginine translocase TatA/TatE family subunit [Parvibaculum sp.]|uniref:twin-arginine translocase TatA/TatE family subunit n=1 Tax=Parvibaculum sp. TaxID=2024848 RepID=UPI002C036195|nr:twin-arginine translocase TatA/TatE family subunit [Parvibaculum sp.]HMM13563.1 twin-arginine translocase TatA/TatE family subunit [Parvibaculum sp.]
MLSWTHILLVVALIVLLFGTGKVSTLMGDVAKGINAFKKGLKEDDEAPAKSDPKVIEGVATQDSGSAAKDKTANG